MYGIFTYIWLIFMVNVGKYTIHGCYGYLQVPTFSMFTKGTFGLRLLANTFWIKSQELWITALFSSMIQLNVSVLDTWQKNSTQDTHSEFKIADILVKTLWFFRNLFKYPTWDWWNPKNQVSRPRFLPPNRRTETRRWAFRMAFL